MKRFFRLLIYTCCHIRLATQQEQGKGREKMEDGEERWREKKKDER